MIMIETMTMAVVSRSTIISETWANVESGNREVVTHGKADSGADSYYNHSESEKSEKDYMGYDDDTNDKRSTRSRGMEYVNRDGPPPPKGSVVEERTKARIPSRRQPRRTPREREPAYNTDPLQRAQTAVNRWDGYSTYCDGDPHDGYGRVLSRELAAKTRNHFHRTVPEHPFGVKLAKKVYEPSFEFPDQRYLQFWTWTAFLRLSPHEGVARPMAPGLARLDISDDRGDWCGTIVLEESWVKENVGLESQHEFVAISHAKNFTEEENDVWTYYIPKEQDQSEWDLYFVLLIDKNNKGISRRVGLGKCFRQAFSASCYPGKDWREIVLE